MLTIIKTIQNYLIFINYYFFKDKYWLILDDSIIG